MKIWGAISLFLLSFAVLSFPASVVAQTPTPIPWSMAGANAARTSWTSETIPGDLKTIWVKPISPYVSQHVQVIGADNKLFVATAKGLYAFDPTSGAQLWVYPTELPLGHSPTYDNGFLYVGGLDKKIHKISSSGDGVWTFTADGGFVTNPIVANGMVYAGNRDGALYAVNTTTGAQVWKFQTGNQINQSAAFANNTLYFVSNDGYAYALNATTGAQIWKSAQKLPSMGFYSWWPVIYQNTVIFTRTTFGSGHNGQENDWLYCALGVIGCAKSTSWYPGAQGTVTGDWVAGTTTLDLNSNSHGQTYADYFEAFPHYRNAIFYDRTSGQEINFDIDGDGNTDAAPMAWSGDAGTPAPPIVSGFDNVLYFRTNNRAGGGFGSKSISGWKYGTGIISTPYTNMSGQSGGFPGDEPSGYTAAGNKIFWNHCCDRFVGGLDLSIPSTGSNRQWRYINSSGLPLTSTNIGMPLNYYPEAIKFFWDPPQPAVFWNENDKVGPTPYNGRLYTILGNSLIAFATNGAGNTAPILPVTSTSAPVASTPTVSDTVLRGRLEQEVSEIVSAGHLKPSFLSGGNVTSHRSREFADYLEQYWHNPADLHVVLLRALPFLSPSLQAQVRSYLQAEMLNYSPAIYSHIGFTEGNQRDPYPYPPVENVYRTFTVSTLAKQTGTTFVWGFPPYNAYALWKYAQAGLGNPATLLSQLGTKIKTPITANNALFTNTYLQGFPLVHNAYIAGYKGYVELAKLAGQTPAQYGPYEAELNRLLALRVQQLMTFPNPQEPVMCENECYYESLITYFNFAYLTPELADYLATNATSSDPDKNILAILQKYQDIAPYWLMAHNGETQGESAIQPYQQTHSLFQALAMVKNAPRTELLKYLDTPIVPVGDLYYIDNLVAVLEVSTLGPSPSPVNCTPAGDTNCDGQVNIYDAAYLRTKWGTSDPTADINGSGTVDGVDFRLLLTNFSL